MYQYIFNTFLARIASVALNFFIVLVIARHAGPLVKGEVTLLITTSWFFIFMSNILGGQALVYLIPRNKIELLVVPAYVWSFIVTIGGFLFLKLTSVVHAEHVTSVAVISFLHSLVAIHQTILFAKKKIKNANLIQVITLVLQAAGIVFCFYSLRVNSAFAYIYASLAAYSFSVLLSFFLIWEIVPFKNFYRDFSIKDLDISFRYGFLYQLTEMLQLLNLRYYFYQIGLQEGREYLGIYSIGISVLEAVWILPRSISAVQYVSTSNSEKIKEEAERIVQLMKLSLAVSAVALFFISLVSPSVYIYIFGEGFRGTRHAVRFLFAGIWVYNIAIIISSFYLGTGRYKQPILANLLGFVTLATLGYYLIPEYVITGAGLSATVSFAVASVILLFFFMYENKLSLSRLMITRKDVRELVEKVRGFKIQLL